MYSTSCTGSVDRTSCLLTFYSYAKLPGFWLDLCVLEYAVKRNQGSDKIYVYVCFVSSPTKITLIGAVLFALQQTHYLPLQKHHLMLFYTIFIVGNKVSAVYWV